LSIIVVDDDRRRHIHFLVVVVVLSPIASPSQFPASTVLIVKFAATMPRRRIATTANRRRTRDARRR
jgi:hypothetical protein